MTRRLLTAALAALLVAGTATAQTDSTKAGGGPLVEKSVRKGNLFSAVTFGDSAIGTAWARLRGAAQERFPDLKLTLVPDLHTTVVYIGPDWKPEDLDRIRALALVVPRQPVRLRPEVVPLGRYNHVVVVELHPESTAWGDSVAAAKAVLNGLGLKRPESYDSNFRAHITLATAKNNPPSPADSASLAAFRAWMSAEVAKDPASYTVTVGPKTVVRLLLAGATRPADAPQYIPVEEFLQRQAAPASK